MTGAAALPQPLDQSGEGGRMLDLAQLGFHRN
jgi:hypothetical protein